MATGHQLSVVDYEAWNKGYMPPSEHILIDQLSYRGARVVLGCDHAEDGAFWVVVRGKELSPKMRKHMREVLKLWYEEEECSPAMDSRVTSATATADATGEQTAITAKTPAETGTDAFVLDGEALAALTGTPSKGESETKS